MADTRIKNSTYTDMTNTVTDYTVETISPDSTSEQDETTYINNNANDYFSYYKKIPELKKAIDISGNWVTGRGYEAPSLYKTILEHMDGWGEDTSESIFWNLYVCKKIYGDAFAEIIRDKNGDLLNLKVLDPATIQVVVNRQGRIKRYEQIAKTGNTKTVWKKYKPNEILHLCNERVADEIHGTSVIQACQWVIDARNEAMSDWRRILHRSTVRLMYIDSDDTTTLNRIKSDWAQAIKYGELLLIPAKKGDADVIELSAPNVDTFLAWIKYLENFFYIALGIPKVILGGSEEFTEASSKIAYLTFEQVYAKEQRELEADLWNQCQLRLTFNKPVSLKSETLSSEEKNTGQVGFQPNATQINSGADGNLAQPQANPSI